LLGLLLDTHALFWLVSGEDSPADQALVEIVTLPLGLNPA
jgi:PIN domain nuclease of toxin-antitoxin system